MGAKKYRILWWRSPQGLSARFATLVTGITSNERLLFSERVRGQYLLPITTSTMISPLLPELLYVLVSAPWMQCPISWWNISQIFQSGTSSTFAVFDGYRGTPSWMLFVNNTPCATAPPNQTFSCLISANSSDLLASLNASMAIELFAFRPVLDGSEGIISDYPARRLSHGAGGRVPFMAGTCP
jgi:hypothetical protein